METATTSQQALIEVGVATMHLGPDSLVIYQPRYTDANKTRIKAIVRMPDGKLTEMEADKSDARAALIRDVFSQYSEAELEMFTHREFCILGKLRELNQRMIEDKKKTDEREEVFQAKAKALALPQIRDHQDKEVRGSIRRASSAFEVMALTVAALTDAKKKSEA